MTRPEATIELEQECVGSTQKHVGNALDMRCNDAISRQAVLDALYELCDTGETLMENPWRDNPHIDALVDAIEELPPVNPQEPKIDSVIEDIKAEINEGIESYKNKDKAVMYGFMCSLYIIDKHIEGWDKV